MSRHRAIFHQTLRLKAPWNLLMPETRSSAGPAASGTLVVSARPSPTNGNIKIDGGTCYPGPDNKVSPINCVKSLPEERLTRRTAHILPINPLSLSIYKPFSFMAGGASGGSRNSVYGVKSKNLLKKGPWTSSEDLILIEYVTKHGEGNWNAVQRNTGLVRCGKSCRLRWANHLRPNLKKGAFSPEEEKLITELHAKFGNKWAKMATMVPGRTDNEIKNYWNTRLKRRQKAGLPIYPQQGEEEEVQHLNSSSSSSPAHVFESLTSPQIQQNSPYFNNGGRLLFGSTNSLFPTSSFFNQTPLNSSPMGSLLQLRSHSNRVNPGLELENFGLPSIQQPQGTQDYDAPPGDKNHGLLQDLLGQSGALAWPEKPEDPFFPAAEIVHGNPAFSFDAGISKGNSTLDEDLLNLLDSFPMSVPIPEWDGELRMLAGDENCAAGGLLSNPAVNQEWNFGSYIWNNMPTIY